MKTLLTSTLFLLIYSSIYSQEVIKKYDKFENKFYLSLENGIYLSLNAENETTEFNLNVLKVYNSIDTNYYLIITAKHRSKFFCSSILSKYQIQYDKDKSILLNPLHYECDEDNIRKKYIFDFSINKTDLLNLDSAKEIKIVLYCTDGDLQGFFSEDNFEDFRKFVKNYVK